jgi:predicted ArsR family transcriptional regulator
MRKSPTQRKRILQYIDEKGSITALEAVREIGCTQLSARLCELEKEGYIFKKVTEKSKNRYGDPVHYKRYSICN